MRHQRPHAQRVPTPRHDRQSGFTLIEVLVSILILSIGVLGAAGMQFAALQSNKEARNQAVGVRYAQELAEKMRANRLLLVSTPGAYSIAWKSTDGVPAAGTDCASAVCATDTDIASWDLHDVLSRISQDDGLPGAMVTICRDANPYDGNGVPQWSCSGNGTLFIKIGWSQSSLDSSTGAADSHKGIVLASVKPSVVFPVGE